MYKINNSKPFNYHKQTNNVRSPSVACFPTSMVNAAYTAGIPVADMAIYKNNLYTQDEDVFDAFLHTPELMRYYKCKPCLWDYIKRPGNDARELWDVEEYAFNKFVGEKVCYIDWNLKIEKLIDTLLSGGAIVTSGFFYRFHHAVSIVGFTSSGEDGDKDPYKLENIIIDDSYGNVNTNYESVGVGGNDVEVPVLDFLNMIHKNRKDSVSTSLEEAYKDVYYGIIFPKYEAKNTPKSPSNSDA